MVSFKLMNGHQNYQELLLDLLENFKKLKCTMNIKDHFLHSYLDKFSENHGSYSEEQGEKCQQSLKTWKSDIKVDGMNK